MERIGTLAKGLPALEWLLSTQPVAPGYAACCYAAEVALNIERETIALQRDFTALAATNWPNAELETVVAGLNEWVNQWVGDLERRQLLGSRPKRSLTTAQRQKRFA